MYTGYWMAFDGDDSWSFGSNSSKAIVIFGGNNSSSSHADNHSNDILVLSKGPVRWRLWCSRKEFSINFG